MKQRVLWHAFKSLNDGAQVGNPVDRLQQLGQQAQLMTEPLEAAAHLDEAAAQREAHAQARLKNKLIAELRDHKRQLAGMSAAFSPARL